MEKYILVKQFLRLNNAGNSIRKILNVEPLKKDLCILL